MAEVNSTGCNRVFEIFKELSKIPRGSGHMDKISDFCVDFAKRCGLKYVCDDAKNVVIYKDASVGCENAKPVILQGHLDMVWQKSEQVDFDFETQPIEVIEDGDFLHANATTLGADNGIAVAMVLNILERDDLVHPPIQAVFTTDEEIGMIGAAKLDTSVLSAKRLINLDSEEDDTVTVSCAGGSDFKVGFAIDRISKQAESVKLTISGLKGGHSGVEINSNRVNSAVLAGRILNELAGKIDFDIVSINSGDKANAIPNHCFAELLTDDADKACHILRDCCSVIKNEISDREENVKFDVEKQGKKQTSVLDETLKNDLIYALNCTPNGITEMSSEIQGLVETSLNLGILSTNEKHVTLQYALRSNKSTSLEFLENKLKHFYSKLECTVETSGHYPPWEYKKDSDLKSLYVETYKELIGTSPKVEAIHAGLECAVFSSSIKDSDCIAIGPCVLDAHTVNERLGISSTRKIYKILLKVLEKLSRQ